MTEMSKQHCSVRNERNEMDLALIALCHQFVIHGVSDDIAQSIFVKSSAKNHNKRCYLHEHC